MPHPRPLAQIRVPSFIGISLQIALPSSNVVGRTIVVILMPSFVGTLAVMMGLPAQNTGGYTKRSVSVGMAFIGYCVGNILGPLNMYVGGKSRFHRLNIQPRRVHAAFPA